MNFSSLRLKHNLQELRRRAREAIAGELPRSPDISQTVDSDGSVRTAGDLPVAPGPDLIIPLMMRQEPCQCDSHGGSESRNGSSVHLAYVSVEPRDDSPAQPEYIPIMMRQEPCQCEPGDGSLVHPDYIPLMMRQEPCQCEPGDSSTVHPDYVSIECWASVRVRSVPRRTAARTGWTMSTNKAVPNFCFRDSP